MNFKLQTFRGFARIANLCQTRQNANMLRLILPLFMTLIFQTSIQAQDIVPIPLTPASFNFDCVAEASPPYQYTTGSMPGGDVIYSSTYPNVGSTGMPASNTISNGTVTYNLQPYTGNNALQLTNSTGSTGDLTFQTPTQISKLHLAAFSVYGTTNVNVVVTFSDNTTEQVGTNFTLNDWFNGPSVVHTLNGRVTSGGSVYNLNSGNPRIYTYAFDISPINQSKLVSKVTVTRTGGPTTSKPYFVGVAGTEIADFAMDLAADTICSTENEWYVPIEIDSVFNDISTIDLVLDYDTTKMTYNSVTGASNLNTTSNPITVIDSSGQLTISWSNGTGATIGNEALMTLEFIPAGGASDFSAIAGQMTDFSWSSPGIITDINNDIIFGAYNDQIGAVINTCYSFSGNIAYNNGSQTIFNNLDIIATGSGLQPDTFSVNPVDGSYLVNTILNGVTYDLTYNTTDAHGGANATDALKILLDTSNTIFLFGLKAWAADVNADNMITGADASEIQSRFVSNSVTSYSSNQDWTFDLQSISLLGNRSNEVIRGIAMGDVNGSLHNSNPITNTMADTFITVNNGDRILLPIRLKQTENIGAMSLVANFPSNAMTIHDVMLGDNTSIMNDVDGDELRAAWTGLNFQNIATDDVLVYIDATINDVAGYDASPLSFSQETELADSTAEVISQVTLSVPTMFVTNTNNVAAAAIGLRNFPNPFSNQMTIEYDLSATSDVSIQVFNAVGQEITQLVNETQQEGKQRAIWNADTYAGGIYFYTITITEGSQSHKATKQVVLIK